MSVTVESGDRRLAAVLFVDVAGYTRLAAAREDEALKLVDLFQSVTRDVVARYGGRVVKFLGDGALVVFSSTDSATRTALKIVSDFEERSKSAGTSAQAHAGIHLGEIVTTADGDAYGDGVNFASRLQAVAEPGQVLVSDYVWRQLHRRDDFELESLGDRELRGIAEPVTVYSVTLAPGASLERVVPTVQAAATMPGAKTAKSDKRRWIALGGALLVGTIVLALLLVARQGGESERSSGAESRVATAGVGQIDRSIAVLPFQNMSADPENEYFSDGITDDILTAISKIDDLRVISRTSTMQYKNTDKDAIQIGQELDVATILEGSVRRQGERVRITAQLVDAGTDEHLWAETYDRNLTDIFEIQSEIAEKIATALQTTLTRAEAEAIAAGRTGNLTAYDLYLKGRDYLWSSFERPMPEMRRNIDTAVDLFNQALAVDPAYAGAYAGLGQAYVHRSIHTDAAWGDSAKVASQKAIELDPNLADGHYALGFAMFQAGDYEGAVKEAERAIELNPNYARATQGLAFSLYELGRLDEALVAAKRAVALEPTDGQFYELVGIIYTDLIDYVEAERWLRKRFTIEPDNGSSHAFIGLLYLLQGDEARAAEEIELGRSLEPLDPEVMIAQVRLDLERGNYEQARPLIETFVLGLAPEFQPLTFLGFVHLKLGNHDEAQELFREAEQRARAQIEPAGQARQIVYLYLIQALALQGRIDEAVDVLEDAYGKGFRDYQGIRTHPTFADLYGNERFEALMTRMEGDVTRMRERVQREGL